MGRFFHCHKKISFYGSPSWGKREAEGVTNVCFCISLLFLLQYSYNHMANKKVSKIPRGKVTTYGVLAKKAGIKSPRLIGRILHENPDPRTIPCHRVVNWKGMVSKNFAFGGASAHIQKIEKEGVLVKKGKVDRKYFIS